MEDKIMKLKNLKLTMDSILDNPSNPIFQVVETNVNRVRNDDGSWTRDVENYSLTCGVRKRDTIKVKVGKEHALKVTEITTRLSRDDDVYVTFTGLTLRAYAMLSGGSVLSGVSANADDFEIVLPDDVILDV